MLRRHNVVAQAVHEPDASDACARHRCEDPQKEVRVSRVLSELNSEENETAMGLAILMFRLHTRD